MLGSVSRSFTWAFKPSSIKDGDKLDYENAAINLVDKLSSL